MSGPQLLVLCYHAISPGWSAPLSVKPDAFERQVTALIRSGWSPATFTDAVRGTPEPKTLAITFDDAFASVKAYAQPVLSRLGAPATVFAPTDYISRQAPLAWTGLDEWVQSPDAHELTPMSWDDLGELAEQGWEIGSHSRTHPHLTTLDDHALNDELCGSREEFAQHFGRPTNTIAYPYGDVDERVADQARIAGYEAGASLAWPSPELNIYRFPRIGIYHKDTWPRFRLKIGGWWRSSSGARVMALRHHTDEH